MFCSPWLVVHLCTIFINSEIVKPQLVLQKSDAIYRMHNVSFARVAFVNATLACHTKRQRYRNLHTIHLLNLSIEQAMKVQSRSLRYTQLGNMISGPSPEQDSGLTWIE